MLQKGRQATTGYFTALIERGQHTGELRPEVVPATAAWMLTAILNEMGNQFRARLNAQEKTLPAAEILDRHAGDIQAMYEQVLAVLYDGILARKDRQD